MFADVYLSNGNFTSKGEKQNLNKEMASTTFDKNGSGKKSTGDKALYERSEYKEVVDKFEEDSEEDSEEDVAEHGVEEPPSREVSKTGKENEIDVQKKFDEMEVTESKQGLGYTFGSVTVLLCSAVLCLIVAIYISPPERDFDLVKVFTSGVDQLQLSFTNQTERFWKILKYRGLAHLRNNNPSRPLVFLLAAPPPAHEWVDCLATKLAEKLDPRHKRNLARIDGADEKGHPPDQVKKKMDVYLKQKFLNNHRVAVIHHLELLPFPSPLLFYSYCHERNAPHKDVAIIFTVHLPEEPSPSLSPREAEGTVEKYLLKQVWRDDMDSVDALLSYIADTVALMNGESNNSWKAYCF